MPYIRKSCALLLVLIWWFASTATAQKNSPLFSFGVIADVQYADAEQAGKRDYRGSPKRLEKCIEIFNADSLEFIVHAGDLIDRYYESYELPLQIFGKAEAPVHYVIGNHEFSVADSLKSTVRPLLRNERGYRSFVVSGVQFILLDAMDVSPHSSVKGSKEYEHAATMLDDLKERHANNAYEWNGAIGRKQLKWLKKVLRDGARHGYRAVLFSHLPLLPENGLQLWNNGDVLKLIEAYPSVVAVIAGHHHDGGYMRQGRVHHLTLKGLVEASGESACAIVEVYPDRLEVNGFGDQVSHTLDY